MGVVGKVHVHESVSMSLHAAALFAKVVELGGFSAAARHLQMPKTTLSKRVRDLERELGVRLLNRTTRRVTLTEAGTRYYEHCTVALRRMATAAVEAREVQHEPAGELRIGGPGSLATTLLAPMLVEFLERHPRYTATLRMVAGPVDLNNDDIDVLVSLQPFDKSVHAVRLAYEIEMGLFASPRYVKGFGAPATPQDLRSHETVCFDDGTAREEIVWRLRRGSQRAAITLETRPRFQSNDRLPMRLAMIAGLGIGILPARLAAEGERAGQLVRVLPAWRSEPAELNALYLDGRASSQKTRAFLDFATEWFKRV